MAAQQQEAAQLRALLEKNFAAYKLAQVGGCGLQCFGLFVVGGGARLHACTRRMRTYVRACTHAYVCACMHLFLCMQACPSRVGGGVVLVLQELHGARARMRACVRACVRARACVHPCLRDPHRASHCQGVHVHPSIRPGPGGRTE